MDSATAARLLQINREFYRQVAPEFSHSRGRLNPGILRAFAAGAAPDSVLDAGCGDGRVGLAWAAGELAVEMGSQYVGLDSSAELLAARGPWPEGLTPRLGDLLHPGDWPGRQFDLVCCFAALHHIPGREARIGVLKRVLEHLARSGRFVVSVWQVLHLQRFRRRQVDWSEVGLDPESLDPGDLLLDWRRGPRALRYVHQYELAELQADCAAAGLACSEHWRSDGETDDLGLYVSGQRANPGTPG
jgi:tRNA (uracil-5-)-methyltransferase TRM9